MKDEERTNLWFVVTVVRDEDEVVDVGRVDLLELGRDHHAGDAQELQLGLGDSLGGEEPIDIVDGQEKSLRVEFELDGHLYQPVDQDGSHLRGQLLMERRWKIESGLILDLAPESVSVDIGGVLLAVVEVLLGNLWLDTVHRVEIIYQRVRDVKTNETLFSSYPRLFDQPSNHRMIGMNVPMFAY